MVKFLPLDVAVPRFRRKVRPLLTVSDKRRMRSLFADLTADGCMEVGEYAIERMVGELKDALAEPHRNIRRNLFPRK